MCTRFLSSDLPTWQCEAPNSSNKIARTLKVQIRKAICFKQLSSLEGDYHNDRTSAFIKQKIIDLFCADQQVETCTWFTLILNALLDQPSHCLISVQPSLCLMTLASTQISLIIMYYISISRRFLPRERPLVEHQNLSIQNLNRVPQSSAT